MKYNIWDNDNAVMVCATESRKEAFTAVLNHLIEANGSDLLDPIMWPVDPTCDPDWKMPATSPYCDGYSLINQALEAYTRIAGLVPMAYPV